ncbi:MAG: dTMP kinase [Pseudanabaenaceae cyanobacterium bins.68]|nr:dTMP kinase [Pseudanabaenaceae cyanobacterium bins.68]
MSYLISFEGTEGVGKSTQVNLTLAWLRQQNYAAITTREPGGTALGQKIRQILLEPSDRADLAELFLFMADRVNHVQTLILPNLAQGVIVLCDRFIDSTVAYQHYGRGLDLQMINGLNQIATQGLIPKLTFWLDLEVETGLSRAKAVSAKLDQFEALDLPFHQRLRQGFAQIAAAQPDRFMPIDASQTVEQIQAHIQQTLIAYLPDMGFKF